MTITWLAVEPLDTIMVRDGRTFDAGTTSRATAIAPAPSTLGGVVHSAVGDAVDRIVGPVVSVADFPVFPAPLDLVVDEPTVRRLAVDDRADSEVSDLDGRQRLSHRLVGDGDPTSAWITDLGLGEWLVADAPVAIGADVTQWAKAAFTDDLPWLPESRLGLARRWAGPLAGTARPGMLYTMTHLRPRAETRFLVGCVNPAPVELTQDVVPLGGRGRLAHVSVIDNVGVFPDAPLSFPDGRVAVYLATPALLDDVLWHPPEATLCALAVSGPQPIATASERTGFANSRQLAWATPAGTVFYLQFGSATTALTWSKRFHGDLLPNASDLPIVTAGFGTCLTGRW